MVEQPFMDRAPGDETADRRDRLLAALLHGPDAFVLLGCDAGVAELFGGAAPLRLALVTVAGDASADQIRARLEPLVKAVRPGGPPAHFVVVGGGAAAGRAALAKAAPLVQPVRMGFHHLDAAGALTRVKGSALPALDEAYGRLAEVGPLGPDALAEALAKGQALARQERAIVDRLAGSRRVTATLVIACAALLAVSYAFGPGTHDAALWRMGANSGEAVRRGELYRLLASAFLHADPVHLFVNMLALWSLGPMLEALLGPRRFLLLYGASALGGSIASASAGALIEGRWGVGASGAIWGLMTAGIGIALRPQGLLPAAMIAPMRSRAWWPLGLNLAYSLLPGIDLLAHLGGGIVGFALVVTVLPRGLTPVEQRERASSAEPRPRPLLTAAAALMGAAMALSVVVALAAGRPWVLGAPPTLTRTAVADTGVALDVPEALASAAFVEEMDGLRTHMYGRLPDTPMMFLLTVHPFEGELTPGEVDELLERERKALEEQRPADVAASGPATRVTLGGRPAVRARNELKNGVQLVSYVVVLEDREVLLQAFSMKDRPASWNGIEDKVAATIRRQ
ncbi:rhomboid family intramembrane serine protease [Sorangium sp. So ce260]|uniref:rhomboid family intramembrane serine protease n=1 Tax=Sorangium sp. So ce260 TaxID=3133291 RepID=UPI003F6458DE